MVTIHLDPSRLSLEELDNVYRALRDRCADCIERNVPEQCQHPEEVNTFLDALASAIEYARRPLEQREQAIALGVDVDSGDWPGA
jgi:hypothetical protein